MNTKPIIAANPTFPKIGADMLDRLAAQAKDLAQDCPMPPIQPTKRWLQLATW